MGRTPFYRTSIELKHHFANIKRTRTCSFVGDQTQTPYFWLRTIEYWNSNIVWPITNDLVDKRLVKGHQKVLVNQLICLRSPFNADRTFKSATNPSFQDFRKKEVFVPKKLSQPTHFPFKSLQNVKTRHKLPFLEILLTLKSSGNATPNIMFVYKHFKDLTHISMEVINRFQMRILPEQKYWIGALPFCIFPRRHK